MLMKLSKTKVWGQKKGEEGGFTKITLDTVQTHAVGLSLHEDIAVRTHTPVTALGVQTGPCPTQRAILNAFINIYRRIAK